jgi:hypothetical protein
LRIAEQTFQQLRAKRDEKREQLRALIAAKPLSGSAQQIDAQITSLANEADALGEEVAAARQARAPHRAKYGAAVQQALAPLRAAAADKFLAALADMQSALADLAESRCEIARAGGDAVEVPQVFTDQAADVARQIAAGHDGHVVIDFESARVR